jgi:hypothetical protein
MNYVPPVLLQVNMHAFSERLSMFQLTATAGGQSAFGGVRSNAFVPIQGSVRLIFLFGADGVERRRMGLLRRVS